MRRLLALLLVLAPAVALGSVASLLRSSSTAVATVNIYYDGGLPDPGVTPGPSWASRLNGYLLAVDAHDHSPGHGAQVSAASLAPGDLHIEGFEAHASSYVFDDAQHTGIYAQGGELWYQDGAGNDVQLTSTGAINVAPTRGINGTYASDGASLWYAGALNLYHLYDHGGNPATLELGALRMVTLAVTSYTLTDTDGVGALLVDTSANRTITLPVPSANNAGRLILVKDRTGGASTHNITVTRQTSGTIDGATTKTISTAYGSLRLIGDGTNWYTL